MKRSIRNLIILSALVAGAASLASCGETGELKAIAKDDIKFGLICLHDENSTYDKNFIDALERARVNLGLREDQIVIKKNIEEGSQCYDAASELADSGCNIIMADSFGHESYMLDAANDFKSVRFCHASGNQAHTRKVDNYVNAFAEIYEGRFLSGIACGLKLKELEKDGKITAKNKDENGNVKLGYVGAWPYAEVKSGYSSWYLGVKKVYPNVVMDVVFTNSWYDPTLEQEGAQNLINRGCICISQHADSNGAPNACLNGGVFNFTYNVSSESTCSGSYVAGCKINWTPYYEYVINSAIKNTKMDVDYCGSLSDGGVQLLDFGKAAPANVQTELATYEDQLKKKTLHVFDTDTFTVGGKKLTSYLADVDDDGTFVGETEVVSDGYFHESEMRSAPYFDVAIDGITTL